MPGSPEGFNRIRANSCTQTYCLQDIFGDDEQESITLANSAPVSTLHEELSGEVVDENDELPVIAYAYRDSHFRDALYLILSFFTLGIFALLMRWTPLAQFYLRRVKCGIKEARFFLLKTTEVNVKTNKPKIKFRICEAIHAKVSRDRRNFRAKSTKPHVGGFGRRSTSKAKSPYAAASRRSSRRSSRVVLEGDSTPTAHAAHKFFSSVPPLTAHLVTDSDAETPQAAAAALGKSVVKLEIPPSSSCVTEDLPKSRRKASAAARRGKLSKVLFVFRCRRFCLDADARKFREQELDLQLPLRKLHEMGGGISDSNILTDRRTLYGICSIRVPPKPLLSLFLDELLHPIYVFQVAGTVFWIIDHYYVYAIAVALTSLISMAIELHDTRANQRRLDEISNLDSKVNVIHHEVPASASGDSIFGEGFHQVVNSMDSTELVPGQVIEIEPRMLMPCDAILLSGSAIVNESMLTGESVPVLKTALPLSDGSNPIYNQQAFRTSTLYAGTTVAMVKHSDTDLSNARSVALVARTGFSTLQGGMMRTIIHPPPSKLAFYTDSLKFVGVMFLIALLGGVMTVCISLHNELSVRETFVRCVDLIFVAVAPALPSAMTVGTSIAVGRLLRKWGVTCMAPSRINVAGQVNTIIFDKTGTLTEDVLEFEGVLAAVGNEEEFEIPEQSKYEVWRNFIVTSRGNRGSSREIDSNPDMAAPGARSSVDSTASLDDYFDGASSSRRGSGEVEVVRSLQTLNHSTRGASPTGRKSCRASRASQRYRHISESSGLGGPVGRRRSQHVASAVNESGTLGTTTSGSVDLSDVVRAAAETEVTDSKEESTTTATLSRSTMPLSSHQKEDAVLLPLQKSNENLPTSLVEAMATCHSLTKLDGSVVGDPVEVVIFDVTGWSLCEQEDIEQRCVAPFAASGFSDEEEAIFCADSLAAERRAACAVVAKLYRSDKVPTTVLPPASVGAVAALAKHGVTKEDILTDANGWMHVRIKERVEFGILRRFDFASNLQRMSVIVGNPFTKHLTVFCKGSPESLIELSRPDTLPSNIKPALKYYTQKGMRVIAFAGKILDQHTSNGRHHRLESVLRDHAERDLVFLGMIIFGNPLKEGSVRGIQQLKSAGVMCLMATGDNPLTAVSVSRDCGILAVPRPPSAGVILADMVTSERRRSSYYGSTSKTQLEWSRVQGVNTDFDATVPSTTRLRDILKTTDYRSEAFVVTGRAFRQIKTQHDALNLPWADVAEQARVVEATRGLVAAAKARGGSELLASVRKKGGEDGCPLCRSEQYLLLAPRFAAELHGKWFSSISCHSSLTLSCVLCLASLVDDDDDDIQEDGESLSPAASYDKEKTSMCSFSARSDARSPKGHRRLSQKPFHSTHSTFLSPESAVSNFSDVSTPTSPHPEDNVLTFFIQRKHYDTSSCPPAAAVDTTPSLYSRPISAAAVQRRPGASPRPTNKPALRRQPLSPFATHKVPSTIKQPSPHQSLEPSKEEKIPLSFSVPRSSLTLPSPSAEATAYDPLIAKCATPSTTTTTLTPSDADQRKELQSPSPVSIDFGVDGNAMADRLLDCHSLPHSLAAEGSHYEVQLSTFEFVLRTVVVYSRMAPDDKQMLVNALRDLPNEPYVAMCGDGANDCSALKAADIGVALSSAQASIAAPFTSKAQTIISCVDILKEGRAALVNSLQVFAFVAIYSLIEFASVSTLYWFGSNFTISQYTWIDLVIVLPLSILASWTEAAASLSQRIPVGSLISAPVLASIVGQTLIQAVFIVVGVLLLISTKFYLPFVADEWTGMGRGDELRSHANTVVFLISYFQFGFVCYAIARNRPFRKPMESNVPCSVWLGGVTLLGLSLIFASSQSWGPLAFVYKLLNLVDNIPLTFRCVICALVCLNFWTSLLYERVVISRLVERSERLRLRSHLVYCYPLPVQKDKVEVTCRLPPHIS